MSERHIHRLIWLGLFVEALTALTVVAALFCGIIQIGAWIADRIPMWAIPPMIVSVPAIGFIAMVWDTVQSADGEDEENGGQSRFNPADRS